MSHPLGEFRATYEARATQYISAYNSLISSAS